jgi:hypothetical protein
MAKHPELTKVENWFLQNWMERVERIQEAMDTDLFSKECQEGFAELHRWIGKHNTNPKLKNIQLPVQMMTVPRGVFIRMAFCKNDEVFAEIQAMPK